MNEWNGGDGNGLGLYDSSATVTGNTFGSALRGVVVNGVNTVTPSQPAIGRAGNGNTFNNLPVAIAASGGVRPTITSNTITTNTTSRKTGITVSGTAE